ncbi:MAG TPA: helix-turn-helix transcriptional regulator [Limnobacter sp.]|nr:helix-turn-helix transcriptional regulator [Limnobacter sp.]
MSIETNYVTEEYRIAEPLDLIAILRALRHEKGYTQQHIADNLQLSQKTVSALERNAHKANFSSIITLLDLLDAELVIRKKY